MKQLTKEKRREAEKIQDKFEPDKVLIRNLQRIVDRLDENQSVQEEFSRSLNEEGEVKSELIKLITKALTHIEFADEIRVSNLKDIPRIELRIPEKQEVLIKEKPSWWKDPEPREKFPDRIKIDWENAPKQKQQEEPNWLEGLIDRAIEKLAKLWGAFWKIPIKTERTELDRLAPQMVILIDPRTGSPMGAAELRPIVDVRGGGGGGATFLKGNMKIQGYSSVASGRKVIATASVAERLVAVSTPCQKIEISSLEENSDMLFIGGEEVVAQVGAEKGTPIPPRGATATVYISDAYNIFIDARTNGDGVSFTIYN